MNTPLTEIIVTALHAMSKHLNQSIRWHKVFSDLAPETVTQIWRGEADTIQPFWFGVSVSALNEVDLRDTDGEWLDITLMAWHDAESIVGGSGMATLPFRSGMKRDEVTAKMQEFIAHFNDNRVIARKKHGHH